MTSRVHRLWSPGAPQRRVFLPNFWMMIVDGSGEKLRPNVVKFKVSLEMDRNDVREYLSKVYGLPVRDVTTLISEGHKQYSMVDNRSRHTLEADPPTKYAYVTLPRTVKFQFPSLYNESTEKMKQSLKAQDEVAEKQDDATEKEKERGPLRDWFGL